MHSPHHDHHHHQSNGYHPIQQQHHGGYVPPRMSHNNNIEEEEEDSLWDQLNDQQSREVQQHQSRFHASRPLESRSHAVTIMASMVTSTAERVVYAGRSALTAAHYAWYRYQHEYPSRQRRRQQDMRRNLDRELDQQFGIPDLLLRPASEDEQDGNNEDHDDVAYVDLEERYNARQRELHQRRVRQQQAQAQQPNPGYPFVVLKQFPKEQAARLLHKIEGQREKYQQLNVLMGNHLDVFWNQLYSYYFHRGITPMCCKFVVEILSLLFTLWLSRILLWKVNWKLLATCHDEQSCHAHWSEYYYSNNNNDHNATYSSSSDSNSSSSSSFSWWTFWYGCWVQGYTLIFLLYAGFTTWSFWKTLQYAWKCHALLHHTLGMSERKLKGGAISWDTIVSQLQQYVIDKEQQQQNQNQNQNQQSRQPPTAPTTETAATNPIPSSEESRNRNGLSHSQQPPQHHEELPSPLHSSGPSPSVTTTTTTTSPTTTSSTLSSSLASSMDPLIVAQRIMRKENFLIAFWNQNLLNTRIGGRQYWCTSLEWCLYTCVLNFMFNHRYEIRPAFLLDSESLKRRFQVCGIVHLLLLPFLILFVSLHFLFRNVYDFKTTRQYMGDKTWSSGALWTFREFNELPHVLEQRLEPSYQAAAQYQKLFGQSEWMEALGKLLVFLGSAAGGLLLVLGVLNDAILLHVQLWGRNLLWYGGIAGIVYSVGKALLPVKEAQQASVARNLFDDMDSALKKVSTHTHYYPEVWKGRGWDHGVYSSFGKFFDSKVKLFIWELVALILAPYILFFKWSQAAPQICEFCLVVKSKTRGAGDVCGYSTFDFDTFQDEAWEGRTLGKSSILGDDRHIFYVDDEEMNAPRNNSNNSRPPPHESLAESILRTGNIDDATRQHPKPKAREGKMEKSFFSFQAAHPNWKCSPSGQSLVDRVEDYRQAAIMREQQLYIEAAARQLETLARLEQQQQQQHQQQQRPAPPVFQPGLHESYVPQVTVPPADAGAGASSRSGLGGPPQQAAAVSQDNSTGGLVPSREQQTLHQEPQSFPSSVSTSNAAPMKEHAPSEQPRQVLANGGRAIPAPVLENEKEEPEDILSPPFAASLSVPTIMPQANGGTTTPSADQQQQHLHASSPAVVTGPPALVLPSNNNNNVMAGDAQNQPRLGLSTDLRRLALTMSALEVNGGSVLADHAATDQTATVANVLGTNSSSLHQGISAGQTPERQYYWLERFHEHLESQRQHQEGGNEHPRHVHQNGYNRLGSDQREGVSDPLVSRSLPNPQFPQPPSSERATTHDSPTNAGSNIL